MMLTALPGYRVLCLVLKKSRTVILTVTYSRRQHAADRVDGPLFALDQTLCYSVDGGRRMQKLEHSQPANPSPRRT